jgi:NADH-quinone oxidoreductase subunit G
MLAGGLKAVLLLNTEPAFDAANGAQAAAAIGQAQMVVTMSPFKANMDISDVLLPIAPFTETSGSFVNAEGRVQSFHAVVRPLGDTRPAWKVLRVLANVLGVPGFDFETSQDVLARATNAAAGSLTHLPAEQLSNAVVRIPETDAGSTAEPVVASIYQLDGLVRRSTSLQLTADARTAHEGVAA